MGYPWVPLRIAVIAILLVHDEPQDFGRRFRFQIRKKALGGKWGPHISGSFPEAQKKPWSCVNKKHGMKLMKLEA